MFPPWAPFFVCSRPDVSLLRGSKFRFATRRLSLARLHGEWVWKWNHHDDDAAMFWSLLRNAASELY
jgi:hypothetical protein